MATPSKPSERSDTPDVGAGLVLLLTVGVMLIAILAIASGEPSLLHPYPITSFLLVGGVASLGYPVWLVLLLVGLIYGLCFIAWQSRRMRRAQFGISKGLLLALLLLAGFNFYTLHFESRWSTPRWQHDVIAVIPPFVLAMIGAASRRSLSARFAACYHALCVAWLAYGAFPYLDELP